MAFPRFYVRKTPTFIGPMSSLESAELMGCVTKFIYFFFWIFFGKGMTVPSFIIVDYIKRHLRRGDTLSPYICSPPMSSPEKIHPE